MAAYTIQDLEDGIRLLAAKNPRDPDILRLGAERDKLLSAGPQAGELTNLVKIGEPNIGAQAPKDMTGATQDMLGNPVETMRRPGRYSLPKVSLPDISPQGIAEGYKQSILKPGVDALTNPDNGLNMGRIMANALSLGGLDYFGGPEAQAITKKSEDYFRNQGSGGDLGVGAGEMAGGAMTPMVPIKAVGIGGSALRGGQAGIQGMIDDYMHGERDWKKLGYSGLLNSGAVGLFDAAVAPVSKWISKRAERNEAINQQQFKTPEALTRAKEARYAILDAQGSSFSANEARDLPRKWRKAPMAVGAKGTKKAQRLIGDLKEGYRDRDMSLKDLDEVRRTIREELVVKQDPSKTRAGRTMVKNLDEFAENTPLTTALPPGQQGPRKLASQQAKIDLKFGRDYAHREARDKFVSDALLTAEKDRIANRGNPFVSSPEDAAVKAARSAQKAIENKKGPGKYTAEELERLNKIVVGTPWRRGAAALEKHSFSGKSTGQVGQIVKGVLGTASLGVIPAVAETISRLGHRATQKEIENLRALIRDPKGKGIDRPYNKETVAKMQDELARIMASGVRNNPYDKPREKE